MKPTTLAQRLFGKLRVSLLFEPRDLWVGAYWTLAHSKNTGERQLYVYLCTLPCLPVQLRLELPRAKPARGFKTPFMALLFERGGVQLVGHIESIPEPGIRWTLFTQDEVRLDGGIAEDSVSAHTAIIDAVNRTYDALES